MATMDTLENDVKETAGEMRSSSDRIKRQFQETGEKIRTQAENTLDELIENVKKHPGRTLGLTLLAGFVVGALASGSRRRRYSPGDQIRDLAATGTDAWGRVRSGFEDAVSTLKDAVEDAVGKFK